MTQGAIDITVELLNKGHFDTNLISVENKGLTAWHKVLLIITVEPLNNWHIVNDQICHLYI